MAKKSGVGRSSRSSSNVPMTKREIISTVARKKLKASLRSLHRRRPLRIARRRGRRRSVGDLHPRRSYGDTEGVWVDCRNSKGKPARACSQFNAAGKLLRTIRPNNNETRPKTSSPRRHRMVSGRPRLPAHCRRANQVAWPNPFQQELSPSATAGAGFQGQGDAQE